MKHFLISVLLFVGLSIPAIAQNNDSENMHSIDIRLQECLDADSNQTTQGMIMCESAAQDQWLSEMTKYYKLLLELLPPEEKKKLEITQKQWTEYRESELDFAGSTYYNMEGTLWRVVAAGRACDIVKQRALELKEYYEMVTYNGEENERK